MFRESHFKVMILSWLLSSLVLSHLDALPVIGSWGKLFDVGEALGQEIPVVFLHVMLIFMYLFEGFRCNTLAFVSSISTESEQLGYIDELIRAPPEILWEVENYHYETRLRTTYVNGTAHTEHYQERVRTSCFHGQLRIDSWSDRSHEFQDLSGIDLKKYALTKIRLNRPKPKMNTKHGDAHANNEHLSTSERLLYFS